MDGQIFPLEEEGVQNCVQDRSLHRSESSVEDEHNDNALNQTYTKDYSSSEQCVSEHNYETGMVVVNVTNQFLRLLAQCGGSWLTIDVDPLKMMMIVDGIRIKEVFSISIGTMGHMVTSECTGCKICPNDAVTPILVWFGETQIPSVRGLPGLVVGREDKRVVVELEQSEELVLFHGDSDMDDELLLNTQLLVWAWKKVVRNGDVKFLEGAAFIKIFNNAEHSDEEDDANDSFDIPSDDIFSPIRSQSAEEHVPPYFLEISQDLDECLSVSFGSVGSHDHEEVEKCISAKNNEDLDEIYFQSLFWRLGSPKLDEIIDAQFDNLLAANNLLEAYNDPFNKKKTMVTLTSFTANTTVLSKPSTEPECEESWPRIPESYDPVLCAGVSKFMTRKLSHTPLSPIPEENTDKELLYYNTKDAGVNFHSGLRAFSTPTQTRKTSDNSESPSSPYPGSNSPVPMMDSGYSDTFTGVMDTRNTASMEVLEQFLEFTEFPEDRRADIIHRFLDYSDKLNA